MMDPTIAIIVTLLRRLPFIKCIKHCCLCVSLFCALNVLVFVLVF